MRGKRVMVYDATEENFLLGASWWWGAKLYRARGDVDAYKGVRSFEEMVRWLLSLNTDLSEVQFWGHGWFGFFAIAKRWISARVLDPKDDRGLYPLLVDLRSRFVGDDALWWFRTCSTFGGEMGHEFAKEWANFFEMTVAGHTHIIGPWQSGLHTLGVDEEPGWDAREGWTGSPSKPKGKHSFPWVPNTIFATQGDIPAGW